MLTASDLWGMSIHEVRLAPELVALYRHVLPDGRNHEIPCPAEQLSDLYFLHLCLLTQLMKPKGRFRHKHLHLLPVLALYGYEASVSMPLLSFTYLKAKSIRPPAHPWLPWGFSSFYNCFTWDFLTAPALFVGVVCTSYHCQSITEL